MKPLVALIHQAEALHCFSPSCMLLYHSPPDSKVLQRMLISVGNHLNLCIIYSVHFSVKCSHCFPLSKMVHYAKQKKDLVWALVSRLSKIILIKSLAFVWFTHHAGWFQVEFPLSTCVTVNSYPSLYVAWQLATRPVDSLLFNVSWDGLCSCCQTKHLCQPFEAVNRLKRFVGYLYISPVCRLELVPRLLTCVGIVGLNLFSWVESDRYPATCWRELLQNKSLLGMDGPILFGWIRFSFLTAVVVWCRAWTILLLRCLKLNIKCKIQ